MCVKRNKNKIMFFNESKRKLSQKHSDRMNENICSLRNKDELTVQNQVNIVFICDEAYVIPTVTAITSLIENKNKDSVYTVYVVTNNLSVDSIGIFNKFNNIENVSIKIIVKSVEYSEFKIHNKAMYVTKSACLKFELGNILSNLDKVLYLDGDVIVQKDLLELYNTELTNEYAAVVKDFFVMNRLKPSIFERLNIAPREYFNSGVMLLNLVKIREDSEEEKEFKIIDRRVSKMRNILEHCSKLPEEDGTGGSALTFMFTTNHPQKMTNIGLLEKKQRINAVISVEPATGEDLKEVLKFHIKRVMPEESSFDLDNYDFTPIMEKLDISEKKGCYHNGQISGAADEIRTAYDKEPSKSFKEHFENMVLNDKAPSLTKRGLPPKVCNKYYNDLVEVGGYINDKSNKVSEEGEI